MGDFAYAPEQLALGDLVGNRFAIALRIVEDISDEELKKSNTHFYLLISQDVEALFANGFINYYGLQRFGSADVK
jgi:tRNA pseudouridine13 synthase